MQNIGGIEQLEKYLKLHEESSSSSSSGATTPPSISQSLYQRVLANAKRQQGINTRKTNTRYTTINRNSKTVQESDKEEEEKVPPSGRGKLQYSVISRNRYARKKESHFPTI